MMAYLRVPICESSCQITVVFHCNDLILLQRASSPAWLRDSNPTRTKHPVELAIGLGLTKSGEFVMPMDYLLQCISIKEFKSPQ